MHTSLFTLLSFTVSTCFGHCLPILRRHYTNAGLVTVVCGCRCGLVSGCGKTVNLNKVKSEVCIKLVLLFTKLHNLQLLVIPSLRHAPRFETTYLTPHISDVLCSNTCQYPFISFTDHYLYHTSFYNITLFQ
jgi:hypothetical protein